jgi:hypothetical protein
MLGAGACIILDSTRGRDKVPFNGVLLVAQAGLVKRSGDFLFSCWKERQNGAQQKGYLYLYSYLASRSNADILLMLMSCDVEELLRVLSGQSEVLKSCSLPQARS